MGESTNHSEAKRIRDAEKEKFLKEHQHSDVVPIKKKEKTGFVKWFCDMFLSGRTLKDISLDILNNQVVPELKDGFRNSVVSLIDMGIYKDHKTGVGTTPGTTTSSSNFIDYANSNSARTKAALEANKKKEEETVKNGYEIPSFKTEAKARSFIQTMHEYVGQFPQMSVFDLAQLMKRSIDYTWDKWGWEKEEILGITNPSHINNPDHPYIVQLPKAHILSS